MTLPAGVLIAFSLCALAASGGIQDSPADRRGSRFVAFRDFTAFVKSEGAASEEVVLTSPEIDSGIAWDEMVASWNADTPVGCWLRVEARAIYSDHATKWYSFGEWSAAAPRESVLGQKDADGDVKTDTLVVTKTGPRVQLRLTLVSPISTEAKAQIRLLGLSFCAKYAQAEPLPPNRDAWGKVIDVPERSQLSYKGGEGWCSPTSTCMALCHWAEVLKRPELARDVPDVAAAVFDKNWHGTGNWPFNTAYAGSFPGMRAYVTRLTDVSELEDWIAAGVPVILSLSYRLLHEKGKSDGHIVVCAGFDEHGDVIINDPWARLEKGDHVRCTCPRANLVKAWAVSRNTVYLVYPESIKPPVDRFGHWAAD